MPWKEKSRDFSCITWNPQSQSKTHAVKEKSRDFSFMAWNLQSQRKTHAVKEQSRNVSDMESTNTSTQSSAKNNHERIAIYWCERSVPRLFFRINITSPHHIITSQHITSYHILHYHHPHHTPLYMLSSAAIYWWEISVSGLVFRINIPHIITSSQKRRPWDLSIKLWKMMSLNGTTN
jgi:hypothetical protein